jgi:hypothetical protein
LERLDLAVKNRRRQQAGIPISKWEPTMLQAVARPSAAVPLRDGLLGGGSLDRTRRHGVVGAERDERTRENEAKSGSA